MASACKCCLDIDLATVVRADPGLQFHWFNGLPNTLRLPDHFENPHAIVQHHQNLAELVECAVAEPGCAICRALVYNMPRLQRDKANVHSLKPLKRKKKILKLLRKESDIGGPLNFESVLGITRYKPASDMKHDPGDADKPLGISLMFMNKAHWTEGKWECGEVLSKLCLMAKPDTYPSDIEKAVWFRQVAPNPYSMECLGHAASWIKDCVENHEKCKTYSGSNDFMPTRVIAVGDTGSVPRLHITHGHPQRYAALSYCWGDGKSLKLTEATLHTFQHSGIPWNTIPLTLADAIQVVRALGIPYVWIDALCIIQDATQDWLDESQRMNDVYMHATVTIVVANAESCSQGIMKQRTLPTEVAWPRPLAPGLAPCTLLPGPSKHEIVQEGWSKRGWTLQEKLSSRRMLTFTEDDMMWDCLTLHRRESGYSATHQLRTRPAVLSEDTFINDGEQADGLAWYEWQEVVNYGISSSGRKPVSDAKLVFRFYDFAAEFGNRTFTFGYDRLPAAAGIAKIIEGRLQGRDTYIAGLWKNQLARGLAWKGPSEKSTEPAPKVVVPSWSWAAGGESMYWFPFISEFPMEGFLENIALPPDMTDSERFVPTKPLALAFDAPVIHLRAEWMSMKGKKPVDETEAETLDLLESVLAEDLGDEEGCRYKDMHFSVVKLLHVEKAPFILRQAETSDAIFIMVLRSVQGRPGVWERYTGCEIMESPQVSREETGPTMEIFKRLVRKEEWQVEHIILV